MSVPLEPHLGCSGDRDVCLKFQTGIPSWIFVVGSCRSLVFFLQSHNVLCCAVPWFASLRWNNGVVWAGKDLKDPHSVFRLAKEVECAPGAAQRAAEPWIAGLERQKGGRKGEIIFSWSCRRKTGRDKSDLSLPQHPLPPKPRPRSLIFPLSSAVAKETQILFLTRGGLLTSPSDTHLSPISTIHHPRGCLKAQLSTWDLGWCPQEERPACLVWVFCSGAQITFAPEAEQGHGARNRGSRQSGRMLLWCYRMIHPL